MVYKEENDKILFTIEGVDFDKLEKFREEHDGCPRGMENGRLSYMFIPTTLGTALTIKCICGAELLCGDFLK